MRPEHREPSSEDSLTPLSLPGFDYLCDRSPTPFAVFIATKNCRLCSLARQEVEAVSLLIGHKLPIYYIDAEEERRLVLSLRLVAVPSLLVFTSGEEELALLGFYSRNELYTRLRSYISTEEDV